MDASTKLFIFMLVVSLLLGTIVILMFPEYRIDKIYQTNKNYYPQINEENIKKEFNKLINRQYETQIDQKKKLRIKE